MGEGGGGEEGRGGEGGEGQRPGILRTSTDNCRVESDGSLQVYTHMHPLIMVMTSSPSQLRPRSRPIREYCST